MSKINYLFLFVPISFALEHVQGISPTLLFFCAAIAIIPIAHILILATEKLAHYTGEAIGGLLNATFGNAPELIICFVALHEGLNDMVRASIIGAILANMLLAQGLSYFLGGLKHRDQVYNPNATRTYSSLMLVAVVSLAVPSAYGQAMKGLGQPGTQEDLLNVVVAVTLLVAYGLYLFFMIKTHPNYFASDGKPEEAHGEGEPTWSAPKALLVLAGSAVLAAFVSEILVAAAEGAGKELGMSDAFIGVVCLSVVGGAAEIASAIAMATRNKMDLAVGISLGSSIQIALFVAPALVLASYVLAPQPLTLAFHLPGLLFLLMSVLIGAFVSSDGRSHWYKGVQLIVVYFLMAAMLYLLPGSSV